jgi:hypothetical protein
VPSPLRTIDYRRKLTRARAAPAVTHGWLVLGEKYHLGLRSSVGECGLDAARTVSSENVVKRTTSVHLAWRQDGMQIAQLQSTIEFGRGRNCWLLPISVGEVCVYWERRRTSSFRLVWYRSVRLRCVGRDKESSVKVGYGYGCHMMGAQVPRCPHSLPAAFALLARPGSLRGVPLRTLNVTPTRWSTSG